jgi:hypothetical protein
MLNADASIIQITQTRVVTYFTQDNDFQSLYCDMALPTQQDRNFVKGIGVCIKIKIAFKKFETTHTITVQMDNKNFCEANFKESKKKSGG